MRKKNHRIVGSDHRIVLDSLYVFFDRVFTVFLIFVVLLMSFVIVAYLAYLAGIWLNIGAY